MGRWGRQTAAWRILGEPKASLVYRRRILPPHGPHPPAKYSALAKLRSGFIFLTARNVGGESYGRALNPRVAVDGTSKPNDVCDTASPIQRPRAYVDSFCFFAFSGFGGRFVGRPLFGLLCSGYLPPGAFLDSPQSVAPFPPPSPASCLRGRPS